jgi:hypothetical protein
MKNLLILLVLICSAGLCALEVSQVNHIGDYTLNVPNFNPVFSTVDSDGSLMFYDMTYDAYNINVRKVICSPLGVISPILTPITCTNPSPWGSVPIFVEAVRKGLNTYFITKTNSLILVFILPDISSIGLPSFRISENHGLSADEFSQNHKKLGNSIYYVSTSDNQLYGYDLTTNAQSVVIPYNNSTPMQIAALGDDYLYIYTQYNNDFHYIIDVDGNVINPINAYPGMISSIMDTQLDIGGGIYPAMWGDGLLRTSSYGYIEYHDGQIVFACLGIDDELSPPYPSQYSCIPLGNQRFICREYLTGMWYFQTYQYANGIFNPDTNFPYINPPVYNAERLFKTSDRYIVGISVYPDNIRQFLCIDLEQQTIQTTVDSMEFSLPDYNFDVYTGYNRLYYLSGNDITAYAVERVTGTSDNIQTPNSSSVCSYPNPFRVSTEIVLKGNNKNAITSVYNIKGQLVRKLNIKDKSDAEVHFGWDGTDQSGNRVPAGMYLYQVMVDHNKKLSGKMVKME